MGDLITDAVEGTLYYVPRSEIARIVGLKIDPVKRTEAFATLARLNTLYMVARAGSGHLGGSFSSLDVLAWLHLEEMDDNDVYFSSKGHDAPGWYATVIGLGRIAEDNLHKLRRLGGLPGHPDVGFPGIVTNTGSLGMGISKAKGMVVARRLQGKPGRIFVTTGDGELQEGQIWESLGSAANHHMDELTVIVDHNKLQSDTLVKNVSDLGDVAAKFAAFGWHVERIDGNDMVQVAQTFRKLQTVTGKPKVIIADTIKGKGVSLMEHTAMESDVEYYRFHSGAPDGGTYRTAAQELIARVNAQLTEMGVPPVAFETVEAPTRAAPPAGVQRLVGAYSAALLEHAGKLHNLVALDADLILDTGLIPFKNAYGERFIECGIAEQDMVSQAGGMALNGLLPVVHSFACFLSARPNEQIYNNATERTHIVYVGSLAGVVPGGPGHSHQAVRDIAAMKGCPELAMIAPCTEAEVAMAVQWALTRTSRNAYVRLESVPWSVPFALPADYRLELGKGCVLTEGTDAALFAYGPVMLSQAHAAAALLKAQGIGLKVIDLPWLNRVDAIWLADVVADVRRVFTLDNHYIEGGQGETILAAMAENGIAIPATRFGLEDIPCCGTNDEVLGAHGLDAQSLVRRITQVLGF
ncbi:transketolase C-terminal domain-containing protein [Magnetospirillum fulvum]|uniref:Transketolase n=1 Tax=Magnetospirillum fulvum TaxID=1082 RepID=A0A1H6H7Q3_MAGFU|nr:transketolase C-terminal domain-containing protein [Magnetospirillum fulvum]SEH30100.1 transketolase [Magnetospirillum fulvum]